MKHHLANGVMCFDMTHAVLQNQEMCVSFKLHVYDQISVNHKHSKLNLGIYLDKIKNNKHIFSIHIVYMMYVHI